ncbi:hypothetical protein HN011_006265 [Eciton burchellii]|nr:hypothetical protein HN011_006265 [Eciton burchellii]
MSEDLCKFLVDQIITISLIKRVIINYKKLSKANVTLYKTRGSLWLRFKDALEEDSTSLGSSLWQWQRTILRKKLSYFLQDEFFAAENIYNDAADHLHDAISNFVKLDNPA